MFVILLFSSSAWAGETTPLEVKEIITPDFNKCVRVIKKPEHYKKWGKISIYAPPLSKMDLATLAYIQKNNIGRIEYCDEKKT